MHAQVNRTMPEYVGAQVYGRLRAVIAQRICGFIAEIIQQDIEGT